MAKRNESQRAEAYRIYMSDSLAFCNRVLSQGKVEYPRFYDLKRKAEAPEPEETVDQIKSRFDVLRRAE